MTKGCRLIVCQVQNADLIAVSLACPKDPTSPYRMHMGPPRESSVRNLMEKVGNLRDIAVLVQLNLAFLTFIDLHLQSNCLGLSSSILNGILLKKNYIYIFWIHKFCILFLSQLLILIISVKFLQPLVIIFESISNKEANSLFDLGT